MRDHLDNPPEDDDGRIQHDMEGEIGDLDLATLSGDMRDEMLSRVKHLKATWNLLSQSEQQEIGNGLDLFAKSLLRRIVGALAKHEFEHVVVTLAEHKIKGGKDIEAKITCPNIQNYRNTLGDHTGSMCMLMMVDAETFFGERAPVKTDPDQPGLNLDGDGEADPYEEGDRLALPPPDRKNKPKPEDLE